MDLALYKINIIIIIHFICCSAWELLEEWTVAWGDLGMNKMNQIGTYAHIMLSGASQYQNNCQ